MPTGYQGLRWLFVAVLIVSLFAACDVGDDGTDPPDEPTPTERSTPDASETQDEYAEIQGEVDFPLYFPTVDELELVSIRIAGPDDQPVVNSVYQVGEASDQRLSLFQSPGPVQHGMAGEITTVEVNGVEAEYSQDIDGLGQETHDLTWMEEGRQYSVSGTAITTEMVMEFAESLERFETGS